MTDYAKIQFATEVAFSSLIDQGKKLGLPLNPVMGLMYLPSQEVTRQFIDACRAVLASITIPDATPSISDKVAACDHNHLNEDGICRQCGSDKRGIGGL